MRFVHRFAGALRHAIAGITHTGNQRQHAAPPTSHTAPATRDRRSPTPRKSPHRQPAAPPVSAGKPGWIARWLGGKRRRTTASCHPIFAYGADGLYTPEGHPSLTPEACAILNTPLEDCPPALLRALLTGLAKDIAASTPPELGLGDSQAMLSQLWGRFAALLDAAEPDATPAEPADATPPTPGETSEATPACNTSIAEAAATSDLPPNQADTEANKDSALPVVTDEGSPPLSGTFPVVTDEGSPPMSGTFPVVTDEGSPPMDSAFPVAAAERQPPMNGIFPVVAGEGPPPMACWQCLQTQTQSVSPALAVTGTGWRAFPCHHPPPLTGKPPPIPRRPHPARRALVPRGRQPSHPPPRRVFYAACAGPP